MQIRRKCWSCRYVSLVGEDIPGRSTHTCPHCGMEAYLFEPNQLDRAKGTPYWPHTFGRVMRVGRERVHLLSDGCYRTDLKRFRTEKLDAFIPSGTIH